METGRGGGGEGLRCSPVSLQIDFVTDEDEGRVVGGGKPQVLADSVQVALRRIEAAPLRDAVNDQVAVGPFQVAFRIFTLLHANNLLRIAHTHTYTHTHTENRYV